MGRLAVLAVALGLLTACPFSFTNEEHCAAQSGDATCASADASRPYCALDGCGLYDETTNRTGCVAEQPPDMACYSPCGGKLDANARADCAEETTSTSVGPGTDSEDPSTSTTTTGGLESSSTGGCACDPAAPICIDGTCVACEDDTFCVANFTDAREVCEAGDCVACAPNFASRTSRVHRGCEALQPNCIDEVCEPKCLLPDDCPQTGCEHWQGLCAPNDRTVYVAAVGGNDEADGSPDAPLQTIGAALASMTDEAEGEYVPTTIYLATGTYTEALEFAGRTVVLRPVDPEQGPPILTSPDARPVFTLLEASKGSPQQAVLNVVGVRFQDSEGPVARVEPTARFMADGVEMLDNAVGIESQGQVFLRNTIVSGTAGPVLRATATSTFGVVASTIVENQGATWFDCSGQGAQTVVTIRDSIVGGFDGIAFSELVSPECEAAAPLRSVLGEEVVSSAFRADYRLELNPGAPYELTEPAFCDEGSDPPPTAEPCPPRLDIDGKSRMGAVGNWIGASVP